MSVCLNVIIYYYSMKKLLVRWLEHIPCFDWLYKCYLSIKVREHRVSLGSKNADKTFYVIGWNDEAGGLFWLVNKVCMHIAYALDYGYIPVVDLKNYTTQYTEKEGDKRKNVWEMFFKQPAGYGLEDVIGSKNVIINRMAPAPKRSISWGRLSL